MTETNVPANINKIGVLTSGGDCAGLNAAVRAVTHRAIEGYGWEVIGIENGAAGLLERPVKAHQLTLADFPGPLMRQGGTVLGTTNKGDPFKFPVKGGGFRDRSQVVVEGLKLLSLDALVAIGGDGSLALWRKLANIGGIRLIGLPKTIDNDLGSTEVSIGYPTAVHCATNALDQLQPTAASHSRVMVLEVMGRDAGHIALAAGVSGGADVILIPEIPYKMEVIAAKIEDLRRSGRNFALVVVAEAVRTESGEAVRNFEIGGEGNYGGIGHYIADRITEVSGAETRITILGHLQRGGIPTPRDRLMASIFGVHAVDLIAAGKFDRMVAWSGRQVHDVPLADAIAAYRDVDLDGPLIKTARGLGICLGDK
ncbi:MAG: ATP-dependent 6-phosphofructokinase [Kiloniellales bacterium]|nr:ATP-dependent 6-phosphofructokinase [Kiloniellales bacterium]